MRFDLNATMATVQLLEDSGMAPKLRTVLEEHGAEFSTKDMIMLMFDLLRGVCGKSVADETVSLLAYIFEEDENELRTTPITQLFAKIKQAVGEDEFVVFLKTCISSESHE